MESKRTDDIKGLKMYNLAEISEVLGITRGTLLACIKDGRLKGIKIANRWRVTEENLKAFANGETARK